MVNKYIYLNFWICQVVALVKSFSSSKNRSGFNFLYFFPSTNNYWEHTIARRCTRNWGMDFWAKKTRAAWSYRSPIWAFTRMTWRACYTKGWGPTPRLWLRGSGVVWSRSPYVVQVLRVWESHSENYRSKGLIRNWGRCSEGKRPFTE